MTPIHWMALGLGAVAAVSLSAVSALPPHIENHHDMAAVSVQAPVPSIPGAHRINGWQHLDDQHVMLRVDSTAGYLITLKSRCPGLSWAQNVAVTTSNNTIWAGFDAITVAGGQCEIATINPLSQP